MKEHNLRCNCIRCREIGHKLNLGENYPEKPELTLKTITYDANKGTEWFLSVIEPETNTLHGFIRMRFPSQHAHRPEIDTETAIIRELHVYGQEVPIGKRPTKKIQAQHRGMGKQLLEKCEQIAKDHGYSKMIVISGIGVREYYKKFGYRQEGAYVSKQL